MPKEHAHHAKGSWNVNSRNQTVTLSAMIVTIALQLGTCACGTDTPKQTARQAYTLPDKFILEPSAERGPETGIFITGRTNLPDGTRIGVEIPLGKYRKANDFLKIPLKSVLEDLHVLISDGRFRSARFGGRTISIPSGPCHVHFLAYFNEAWQTPEILGVMGRGGHKLHGPPLFKLEDPDVIDSNVIMDYVVAVDIPPMSGSKQQTTAPGSSKSQRAIELVKKAVLVVDGSRSSMTVEDGFAFYRTDPAIRLGVGWSASQQTANTFLVTLRFLDGNSGEAQAIWSADLATKKVRYINKAAKALSYIPPN